MSSITHPFKIFNGKHRNYRIKLLRLDHFIKKCDRDTMIYASTQSLYICTIDPIVYNLKKMQKRDLWSLKNTESSLIKPLHQQPFVDTNENETSNLSCINWSKA